MRHHHLPGFCLSREEMKEAEQRAITHGVSGLQMMGCAGREIAKIIKKRFSNKDANILVLCGSGNNGGDGFVVAKHLHHAGYRVHAIAMTSLDQLAPDALYMAKQCNAPKTVYQGDDRFWEEHLAKADLVIDALFGTGLSRPIEGNVFRLIEAVNKSSAKVIAIDIPSGIDANTGGLLGIAMNATMTVTFEAKKPGHILQPGKAYVGELQVVGIDIPTDVMASFTPSILRNTPMVWGKHLPIRPEASHKYHAGHLVVRGGEVLQGAAKLVSLSGLRVGAGLVTIAVPSKALPQYCASNLSVMQKPVDTVEEWNQFVSDPRVTAMVIGPGNGVGELTKQLVFASCRLGKSLVLDADGLTSVGGDIDSLTQLTHDHVVITPHEGEWERCFARKLNSQDDKVTRARATASLLKGVVVLKGNDTVIASHDGRIVINDHTTSLLATAGTGDVLSGLIAGLMAAGMKPFEAACAAVWIHGDLALRTGIGMISEDLPDTIPEVLQSLYAWLGKV